MYRLLSDAKEIDESFDAVFSLDTKGHLEAGYADIVKAINIVQTEMGITGTTAKEASETISGSAATMKAAWENLVVGLADENANVDELLDNFLDSVETTAGNILPVVERVLGRIFQTLADNGPEIIAAGARLLGQLAAGGIKAIPEIVASIPTIVEAIVDGFVDSGPEFKAIGQDIVRGVWSGIQSLASWIGGKVKGFLGDIVDGAKNLLGIHSPSTVFAGMGENMVLGLEKGWDDNIGQAQRDIEKGLDFGTANMDYSASAAGRLGSAMTGGMGTEPITIIVQSVLEGRIIGETAAQYSREQQRAFGW